MYTIDDFSQFTTGVVLGYKYHLVSLTVKQIVSEHSLPDIKKIKKIKLIYWIFQTLAILLLLNSIAWDITTIANQKYYKGWDEIVVLIQSLLMISVLFSYLISFLRLGRAMNIKNRDIKQENNLPLYLLNLFCFLVIIVSQLSFYFVDLDNTFIPIFTTLQLAKQLLRIVFAFLLQRFGQDLTYRSNEKSTGEIEI